MKSCTYSTVTLYPAFWHKVKLLIGTSFIPYTYLILSLPIFRGRVRSSIMITFPTASEWYRRDFILPSFLQEIAHKLSDKLVAYLSIWLDFKSANPLLYDKSWGGMVSCGCSYVWLEQVPVTRYAPSCSVQDRFQSRNLA